MTIEKEVKFIEMFSGIGGFRLGLERTNGGLDTEQSRGERRSQASQGISANTRSANGNGRREHPMYRCVWANDNDKYANKIYTKNFGSEELIEGDIRDIKAKKIPDCDLLTAGFPCQAFSVAGKRKATKEARGTLFTHIARVAAHKRPKLLLLENVKGLLSSSDGRDFAIILRTLANLGYLLEWQVLNSKHHGVPQNRERVFIVGHLGGPGSKQIFPIREVHENRVERDSPEQGRQVGATLSGRSAGGQNARGNYVMMPRDISICIDKNYWKGPDKHGQRTVVGVTLANTSRYKQGVNRTPLKQDNQSWCLNKSGDQGVFDGFRIRRLTPVECERLQGFPDGWTEGVSDTQRYKLLGNAVTVNVIEFLGRKLIER